MDFRSAVSDDVSSGDFEEIRESVSPSADALSVDMSRDEMNLAEFPLAVLSTRVNPKIKTLEFSDTHKDKKTGEVIEKKWIITGADKFGLPTATDDDVILGLIRLTMDQGFRERKVYFSRYELLQALRWSTEGRSYRRLTKSLDRLSGVRIRATNAFYDNLNKSNQTCNFGIIDAYEINDSRASNNPADKPKSFFIWSEVLFDSFKSGFVKKLDLNLYFSLKSAVSRRLYRYLDKHFYFRSTVERNLMTLAFEKLGLSRSYQYVSSIKQQLEPAFEELINAGFLGSYEYTGVGTQTGVRFSASQTPSVVNQGAQQNVTPNSINSRVRAARNNSQPEGVPQKHTQLVEALVSRGISYSQAIRLMNDKNPHDSRQIEAILRYYDHLVENRDHKVSRNRIGFLYRAIEHPFKFVVPPSFQAELEQSHRAGPQSDRNVRSRPELKIFRSEERPRGDSQRAYQKEVKPVEPSLGASVTIEQVRKAVEQKIAPLRSALSEARYRELFEGCVRDELAKFSSPKP